MRFLNVLSVLFSSFLLTFLSGLFIGFILNFVVSLWSNADGGSKLNAFVVLMIASITAFIAWFNKRYSIDFKHLIEVDFESDKSKQSKKLCRKRNVEKVCYNEVGDSDKKN